MLVPILSHRYKQLW